MVFCFFLAHRDRCNVRHHVLHLGMKLRCYQPPPPPLPSPFPPGTQRVKVHGIYSFAATVYICTLEADVRASKEGGGGVCGGRLFLPWIKSGTVHTPRVLTPDLNCTVNHASSANRRHGEVRIAAVHVTSARIFFFFFFFLFYLCPVEVKASLLSLSVYCLHICICIYIYKNSCLNWLKDNWGLVMPCFLSVCNGGFTEEKRKKPFFRGAFESNLLQDFFF